MQLLCLLVERDPLINIAETNIQQKLVIEWPKPELAQIPSLATWTTRDINSPSALLDWLTGNSPAWIFITTVPPSFLTARRKVNFARGEKIAAGCSLHVEMWGFYSSPCKHFQKRIRKGRVVGHGWWWGGWGGVCALSESWQDLRICLAQALCLGLHLRVNIHDSTPLIHVN